MVSEKVLICGAGVAGSTLAYWLARHEFQVTVIERSKAEQKLGQGIEIEEPALQVVKSMGILDQLKERRTGEKGAEFLDQYDQSCGVFGIGGFSPTGALELMRGDLTEVLYQAADQFTNVTYQYETTIQSLRQTEHKVVVELQQRNIKNTKTEEFNFVIGADGVKSRTRQQVMGSPQDLACIKPIGAFVAYFSIPKENHDWPYSRVCHFPNRRILWTRPIGEKSPMTSVAMIHLNKDIPALRQVNALGDRQKQKEAFAELYSGIGWEAPRVVEQMLKADNFYSDELVQVKLSRWSQHRVALVGDAAWAPSPFTGEGNQLAIIGAWVLAQEMSRDHSPAVFTKYEDRLRSYVENAQNIPLWGYAPYLLCPESAWGIWLLRTIVRLVAWITSWVDLAKWLPDEQHERFDLQIGKADVSLEKSESKSLS